MRIEPVLFALLLGLALLPILGVLLRRQRRGVRVAAAALWMVVALGTVWAAHSVLPVPTAAPEVADRPIQVEKAAYVSSDKCQSCHPHNYDTWHDSYHRTMTTVASEVTVKGQFDGNTLFFQGIRYRPEKRGDEFWVVMDDHAWTGPVAQRPEVEHRVVMITGSHHMQIYWYPSGQSRVLGQLPIIWLIDEQRWIPRDAAFLKMPQPVPGHEYGRWNLTCIQCHATAGQPRLDLKAVMDQQRVTDADTRVSEFGIACEACHGPAEEHIAANQSPGRRYKQHMSGEADGSAVDPAELRAHLSAQTCGQCHSISRFYSIPEDYPKWNESGYDYRPGDDLWDTRYLVRPALPLPDELRLGMRFNPTFVIDRYWPDGMVRVSGREYNGLVESPCFEGGEYSCLSCHRMHQDVEDTRPRKEWANDQLAVGMNSDEACLQCHEKFVERPEAHSFHKPESTGTRCYNCHMPNTTYGLLKAMRSHQVDSPTVQNSLETGRPNACNLCHLDKTLDWTAEYLEKWYETPRPALTHEQKTTAASLLWMLKGEAGQRALLAWHMGWGAAIEASGSEWMQPHLALLLDDPYDAVRFIAGRSLGRHRGFEDFEYDFVASPSLLTEKKHQALALWESMPRSSEVPDTVLLSPAGRLVRDGVASLLRTRDNRPMNLKE